MDLPGILAAIVVGVYPSYPPEGPLKTKTPAEQARLLKSMGVTLAGGRFQNKEAPQALRAEGIRTFGLVVLFQGEKHWKSHPESRPITVSGDPLPKDRWYAGVCPNQDWLRKEILAEIREMLASGWYDVINLDFIRYPVHWEVPAPQIHDTCYCPVCLAKFSAGTGIALPADRKTAAQKAAWIVGNHDARWRRWRADQITEFCQDVKRLRDRLRPETLISLAAVPWQPADYDNAIYRIVGQDFRALSTVIDVFQPMSYHVLNGRKPEWIAEVNEYLARETAKPLWPFVIFDPEHDLPPAQWRLTLEQALRGSSGLVAFPFPKMQGAGLRIFTGRFAPRTTKER